MREKKSNLTSRGRRMLIMALTVTGCVVGVAAAVMISAACRVKGRGAYVPAGKNDAAAVIRESAADNQQESNIEHSSESISPQWHFLSESRRETMRGVGKDISGHAGEPMDKGKTDR